MINAHDNQIVWSDDAIIFWSRFVLLKASKDQTHFLPSSKKGKFKNGTQTVLLFHNERKEECRYNYP